MDCFFWKEVMDTKEGYELAAQWCDKKAQMTGKDLEAAAYSFVAMRLREEAVQLIEAMPASDLAAFIEAMEQHEAIHSIMKQGQKW